MKREHSTTNVAQTRLREIIVRPTTAKQQQPNRIAKRRGLTLPELVMSLAIMAILVTATGGALQVMTLHGTRLGKNEELRSAANITLARMTNEMRFSLDVTKAISQGVTFLHPDVTGDGVEDEVAYTWSGTVGHSLNRIVNGGSPEAYVDNVQLFEISYDTEPPATPDDMLVESAEQELFNSDTGLYAGWVIGEAFWIAQSIPIAPPKDAVAWKVTRVAFFAQEFSKNPTIVSLVTAGAGGRPSPTPIGTAAIDVNGPIMGWHQVAFPDAGVVDADQTVYVRFSAGNRMNSSVIAMTDRISGAQVASTSNQGASWVPESLVEPMVYVWGTYYTMEPGVAATGGELRAVKIHIIAKEGDHVLELHGGTNTLNWPETPAGTVDSAPASNQVEPAKPEGEGDLKV